MYQDLAFVRKHKLARNSSRVVLDRMSLGMLFGIDHTRLVCARVCRIDFTVDASNASSMQ